MRSTKNIYLPADAKIVSAYIRFSKRTSIAVIVLAVLVLFGWTFDVGFLKGGLPGLLTMKPQTAICFILCGISLLLSQPVERFSSRGYLAIKLTSISIVSITALSVIVADIFKLDLFIDLFFFKEKVLKDARFHPGRMAEITALCFFLTNMAMLSLAFAPKKYFIRQVCTIAAIIISFMAFMDYLFWHTDIYYLFNTEKMALNTSICFILLSLAILFAWPATGLMAVVSSDTLGGRLIRSIYVKISVALLVLIELSYVGQNLGLFDFEFGIAISAIIALILLSFTLWIASKDLAKRDVEQRRTEKRLILANRELERQSNQLRASNRELERFAQISAHDLQEPLKTISNYSGLIDSKYKGKLDKEGDIYLNFLKTATRRMRHLIRDSLEYSRVDKLKTLVQIDCNSLVKDIVSAMAETIKENDAKINISPLPVIHCYPSIKKVFENLIANAIKFRKPMLPPTISINCESKNDKWLFSVKDNGIGIEKEYYDRIFVLFQKLHSPEEYEGTGIGLALCEKIINMHEGKIWVDSQSDTGTTFYFTISKLLNHKGALTHNADDNDAEKADSDTFETFT